MRVIIWSLALAATAGAVLSVDKVLRDRTAEESAGASQAVILPPSSAGGPVSGAQDQNAAGTAGTRAAQTRSAETRSVETRSVETRAVETVARNVAAPTESTGVVGGAARRDDAPRDEGGPAFDVARIEPSGDSVIAGRAAPGATVELLRNGIVHDRVVADASGQFAMVPPRLPAGDSELTLRSRPPGGTAATSQQSVIVAVQPNLREQPVVALMTPDKPGVVLSKPEGPATAAGSVVVEAVEAEPGGRKLYVSGRSSPRASVRLYLNDSYQGATTADAKGRFTFTTVNDGSGPAGAYQVRLDEVDRSSGAVRSRAEVPFTPPSQAVAAASARSADVPTPDAGSPGAGTPVAAASPRGSMVVSRGDTLWRISRAAYGNGARYMVIYDANHNQIRNPDRIYPGQIFVIPGKGP